MESPDLIERSVENIEKLFPNVVTEVKDEFGNLKKAIDFEKLKEILTGKIADGSERYEFTWPGKKEAIAEAYRPIRKTLRPKCESSRNWNNSKNLYIEGDNLEVLKLLQEGYLNKVKMIYIDPPYNTGTDFIYKDNFSISGQMFEQADGSVNEEGNRFVRNVGTNGRFHSDWCSMIYSRLLLSRNLLTEDGVAFISIDDHEQENLRKICDEIFGEQNFVAQLIWERAFAPKNDAKYISNSHDYILMYAKNLSEFKIGRLPRTKEADSRYKNPDNDPRGVWMSSDISVKTYSAANDYPITLPSGRVVEPPAGRCWSLSKNKFLERLQDNRIWFGPDGNGTPRIKRFLSELKFEGMAPTSILFYKEVGHSQEGAKETSALLGGGYFDGPKPIRLLKRLMTLANLKRDSIVLDFFSGSASTAQALLEFNEETGRECSYIMVQIPADCDHKGKAYQAGYKNICQIAMDRIKKAEDQLADDYLKLSTPSFGFRRFILDSSNMKDIYYSPAALSQSLLFSLESNIKEDRTDLDLLFGCLLDWGLELSKPHTHESIDGCTVHFYDTDALIACFDEHISEAVIKAIAKCKPLRAVFCDNSFSDDTEKVNVREIFKLISPDTEIKVL